MFLYFVLEINCFIRDMRTKARKDINYFFILLLPLLFLTRWRLVCEFQFPQCWFPVIWKCLTTNKNIVSMLWFGFYV